MEGTQTLFEDVNTSVEEGALKKLNPGAFNAKTILNLLKILSRSGKNEDKIMDVACVLSCLEHFLDIDVESGKWEQLGEDVSKLCEAAFIISDAFIKNEALTQRSLNLVSAILDHNNTLADSMLRHMLKSILKSASSPDCSLYNRQNELCVSATLLQKSSRPMRLEILPSVTKYLEILSNYVLSCGNYETQVAVIELLARSWIFIKDNEPALFSDCPELLNIFNNYKFLNFDPECRLFLNEVNERMGDKQLVYSIPCMIVCADKTRLKKPIDPLYKEFWVDFNILLKSISFYYLQSGTNEWEMMTIYEESVLYATATDSSCQSKDGEVLPAIKMVFTLKHDATNLELPKVFKIYSHKTSFAKFEKMVLKNIFNDKYQSRVTYSDVTQLNGDPEFDRVPPVPPAMIIKYKNTPVVEAEDSCVEMKTAPAFQGCNRSESEGSDVVNLTSPSSVPALLHEQTKKTVQSDVIVAEEIPRCSDSFAQYVNQLREQESHTNIVINDSLIEDDEMIENIDKIPSVSNNGTTGNDFLTVITNQNIPKANILTSVDKKSVSSPALLLPDKLLVKNTNSVDSSIDTDTKTKNQKKDITDLRGTNSISKKRRLYSREHSDIKNVILSSQDEPTAEIPEYKIRKQEPQIKKQQNVNRENISYSYIKYKENKNKSVADDGVILDVMEDEEQLCDVKTSQDKTNNTQVSGITNISFKYFYNNDKKLQALNKTPENTKRSNIFASHTVYSDLTSSQKSTRFKKTYARPKPKKGSKRARIKKLSSDSDSDYVPPEEKTHVLHKRGKKTTTKSNVDGFVTRLPNKKIDPTRGIMTEHDMELKPLNLEIEKSEIELIEINEEMPSKKIPHPVTFNEKKLKSKKDIATVESKKYSRKKPTNKIKKDQATQIKKSEGQKRQKATTEKPTGDIAAEIPAVLDLVNYEPPDANNFSDSDELALDIYTHPLSQDKAPVQTAYKINDMIQSGKYCLTQVKSKLQNIQSLAEKERDMNFAAFEFKTQASCSTVSTQCQKLETVSNNLIKARSMLESTLNMQIEIAAKIQAETVHLEEAKQELKNNLAKIGKSETSSIADIFQEPVRYMKNLVLSFIYSKNTKKALPN